jgi:cytidylate kinase
MTADPETRAYRRLREMQNAGKKVSYDEVLENVLERDRIDSERAVAPCVNRMTPLWSTTASLP